MKTDDLPETGSTASDRRDAGGRRIIGNLVSLNGMHGVIACEMRGDVTGDYWSVGNLISVVHDSSRLVGVVCDITTADQTWSVEGSNHTLIKIELSGEIVDEAPGKPVFHRGIRSFPTLGAIAHRIRAGDLRAIYTVRGVEGVEIGRLTQNETIPATVSVEELTKRHFAVVGSTGVGKTTAVAMLAKTCIRDRPDMRVLIVDPHNEYAAHFGNDCVVLDADTLELPYWMFKFDEITDVIFGGRRPNPDELDALYEVIRTAKARFGSSGASRLSDSSVRKQSVSEATWISADTPVPYRVSDVAQILDDWMGKLDPRYQRADLRSLKNRFEALSHDPRYRFMFGRLVIEDVMARVLGHIFRMPKGDKPVTIIQVAGLPNEVVNAAVSVIARMAFETAVWSMDRFQVTLICEEAHRYIPSDSSMAFDPTRRAIGRIAKEGRKYGVALGVVTQRPADLDATVLSQCSTMFAMRLANDRDKAIIGSAVGAAASGPLSFLSSLADREAIAFGEAISTPMRMKFGDYREFEAARSGWAEPKAEDVFATRNNLRSIVSRMRGEFQAEGSVLRQA